MPDENKFINPFHFVPPGERVDAKGVKQVAASLQDKPAGGPFQPPHPELLHDRYVSGSASDQTGQYFSGRIVCKLTTMSPSVFGNEHLKVPVSEGKHADQTTRVDNFSIDGRAAIAGTSLKGMLSTIAEIASGSAMRVLNNRVFSIRSSMLQSRSAIGMIVERNGQRKLLPLTLPTFRYDKTAKGFVPTDGSGNAVWRTLMASLADTPFGKGQMPVYVSHPGKEHQYYPARRVVALPASAIPTLPWDGDRPGLDSAPEPILKRNREGQVALIRPAKHRSLPAVGDVRATSDPVPGIVRSLDDPRTEQGKVDKQLARPRYSLFVPIAQQWCEAGRFVDTAKIPDGLLTLHAEKACRDFEGIAGHPFTNAPHEPGRSATSLRNHRRFQIDKKQREPKRRLLRDGDLVFFRLTSETVVESVAISGIWREGARWLWDPESGEAQLLGDNERRPMNKDRQLVTMAEKMFGWVDDVADKKDKAPEKRAAVPAYKGRIRISDAVSATPLEDAQLKNERPHPKAPHAVKDYFPIKILASPKPPCPEFYLTDPADPANPKIRVDFLTRESVQIQGTKFYWVHPETYEKDGVNHWKTGQGKENDELKQKCFVRPIRHGVDFWFHVDFENLTETELQLLCYSLQPGDGFLHRCGFAKPLGLGAVRLTPVAIAYLDRRQRYGRATGLLGAERRYVQTIGSPADLAAAGEVIRQYGTLVSQSGTVIDPQEADSRTTRPTIGQWSAAFAGRIAEQHAIVQRMGSVPDGSVPVRYPHLRDCEEKIYEWFVANRHDARGKDFRGHDTGKVNQCLQPLTADSDSAPALDKNPWSK